MTVHHALYGLSVDQIVIPDYQDCYTITEAASAWRGKVRGVIREIRMLRAQVGRSRDLNERYILNIELKNRQRQLVAALEAYRTAHKASHLVAREFVKGLPVCK